MNADTLHAVDALYLENFVQTLLFRALDAKGELRESLKQAEALSATENLSPDCRSRYAEVAKRLGPLVSELSELAGDLYIGGKFASDCEPLVQWGRVESVPEYETRAVIEQFNLAEQKLMAALNHIGDCLASMPEANVLWNSQARVRTYLKLKPIPGRPCYQADSMVRFCASPPYQGVYYFTKSQAEGNASYSDATWFLDPEFDPLTVLPLFEDIEIELEVRGDMITSSNDRSKERVYVINLD